MDKELKATKDENGQVTFAAAVYFDEEMTVNDKMEALKNAAYSTTGKARADAVMYLKRLTAELDNEFMRSVLSTDFNLMTL